MKEGNVGRMQQCDNLIIRPPIAIGATMDEWNGGMLEDVFTTKVRRTRRNGQIFEVERHYKCCLALGLKQKKEKQIFIPAFLILNLVK
jgi:hypothetical protein